MTDESVEPPGPWPGDQVLVDTTAYGVPGANWCTVVRRLGEWSAAVYPLKVQIPDRGVGQYKLSEVAEWRTPEHITDMLADVQRMTGARVLREADGYTYTASVL